MYLAIRMWGNGTISLGMIVLLQTYILRLIDFLWGIGQTLRHTFIAISEASEILGIIDTPHEIQDKSDKKLKVKHGEIRLEGVDFNYGENQIFHNLKLHIKPSQRVALVGESGSGKTTITKLLFRLYDIPS
jgi:ABC transporter-related protein